MGRDAPQWPLEGLAGMKCSEDDKGMLSYLMRQTLLDTLSKGPPYELVTNQIDPSTRIQILAELGRRGLIIHDPLPVLTETGIAEAKWFADQE